MVTGCTWLEEMQGFWEKPRGSALSHEWSDAPTLPFGSEQCLSFSGTMDFTGISCKECVFGLLETSWGSEMEPVRPASTWSELVVLG